MNVVNNITEPLGMFAPGVCFLGIGGNLGDPVATLRASVLAMDAHEGINVDFDHGIASLYETAPVGCDDEQPNYVNSVILVETTLSPLELLRVVMGIERDLGRVREERWGARTLDIDLLLFGHRPRVETEGQLVALSDCHWVVVESEELTLPHPRLCSRRFVLEPLAEIGRRVVHPVSLLSVAELALGGATEFADQVISRISGTEWVENALDAGDWSKLAN